MQNSKEHFDYNKRLAITNSRHLKLNRMLKNHFAKNEKLSKKDN